MNQLTGCVHDLIAHFIQGTAETDAAGKVVVDKNRRISGEFWRGVRAAWDRVYAERDAFEYLETVDGQDMFVPLFEYAERLDNGEAYDSAAAAAVISRTFAAHLR